MSWGAKVGLTHSDFGDLLLFDAFDFEHAGMIAGGLATRWPEEAEAERAEIAAELEEILATRKTQ